MQFQIVISQLSILHFDIGRMIDIMFYLWTDYFQGSLVYGALSTDANDDRWISWFVVVEQHQCTVFSAVGISV